MFNWFRKKEVNNKQEVLCSMCKTYKPITTKDMGDEFCFLCVVKRAKEALGLNQYSYQPERSKREETTDGHNKDCMKYLNKCLHSEEFKNECIYKDNCEFINPVVMRCSEHCRNAVRDKLRKSPPIEENNQ